MSTQPEALIALAQSVLQNEAESHSVYGWTCTHCGDRATSHTPSGVCGMGGQLPCPCPGYKPHRSEAAILATALLEVHEQAVRSGRAGEPS